MSALAKMQSIEVLTLSLQEKAGVKLRKRESRETAASEG